jgi:hypothetical protein
VLSISLKTQSIADSLRKANTKNPRCTQYPISESRCFLK